MDTSDTDPQVDKPKPTSALIDLLLRRASVRLESGDGKSAADDLRRIAKFDTLKRTADQQGQFTLIQIRIKLAAADLDGVFADAAGVLKSKSDATTTANGNPLPNPAADAADKALREGLVNAILVQTEKHIESKQVAMAKDILSRLRLALGTMISNDLESRISTMERKLEATETGTS
jgi:negative regulator of replication initiation